ncbi:heavy metal-associated isoprenylated plant protein 4 isoform X2 [Euphorbia lathyris]|uniref:heavy metal-associated isoprenylated plant protein 4 isoform X2 n=1 Tax=Euphorbia lathyris TaxID=212925 RepID=UPI0033139974
MAANKQKTDEVIIAVYKVNLHCQQCARDIKKPLLTMQGVHSVDADFEKAEIKVKGVIDVIKIHKKIEKMSKKKVELLSPLLKKEIVVTEKKVVKEIKQVSSTTVKVHMHCDKCENDLRTRLLKHKGIYSVKTDMKTQHLTVEGTIESEKLLAYIRKKVHKKAEILASKIHKKEEKKEEPKKAEVKSIVKVSETKEFKTVEKVELGNYFIHHVYAPQLFSDENPNACTIM